MFENEWIGLGLLFVVISGGAFLLLQLGSGRRRRVESRLAGDSSTQLDSTPELLLGDLTPALAEQTPMSEQDRTELERELRDAGFYRRTAVMEYAAIRAVLVFAPLLVAAVLALYVDQPQMPAVAIGGVVLAALGYSLPRIYLGYVARARTREVERGLPIALDLMTLGLSAGLTVLGSLKRVAVELKSSYPVLAYEMEIVAQQAELRSLEHALQQLADRVRIPEVRNLAMLLVQSERLGTDIGSALLEFSSSFRTTMRQRADAQANKASFWMAFPTILCLWVAAAIVLVGPIYFEFWHRRGETYEIFKLRAEKLRKERERREKSFETGPQAMPVPAAAEEPEQ
jgi:tight adherence protein C